MKYLDNRKQEEDGLLGESTEVLKLVRPKSKFLYLI